MKSLAALVIVSMFLAAVAYAEGVGGGVGIEGTNYGVGEPSGISFHKSSGGPSPTSGLLLESGTGNYLLLEDGSSKLCLESGC